MKNITLTIKKISLLSLFLALFSCASIAQKGSGNVIKKNVEVSSFDAIKIGGAYEVYLRQGDKEEVTLVADDNIIDNIEVVVSNGELSLKNKSEIHNPTELKAFITVKELNRINISGACELEGKNTIHSKNLAIKSSGASDIELAVRCSNLKITSSGAADMKLNGDATIVNVDASGATTIKAENLSSNEAFVESSGASTVKLAVAETLDAKASGASTIRYRGNAKVNSNTSGAADIKKM